MHGATNETAQKKAWELSFLKDVPEERYCASGIALHMSGSDSTYDEQEPSTDPVTQQSNKTIAVMADTQAPVVTQTMVSGGRKKKKQSLRHKASNSDLRGTDTSEAESSKPQSEAVGDGQQDEEVIEKDANAAHSESTKLAPENDVTTRSQTGSGREYWDKAPPPHYRDRIKSRARTLANEDTPDQARDSRWYAGYRIRENLAINPRTYGLFGRLSRFRATIEENDMSLIQILVGNENPSHKVQTLEAGWQRESHGEPTLFIFFTTNDYGPRGWGVCGYVTPENNMGYVYLDKDKANYFRPGVSFLPSTHIATDPQYAATLQWHLVKGIPSVADGWYLAINDRWNGYFPLRFFELGVQDKTLTLANHADTGDFYGEVADNDYNRALPDTPQDPQKRTTSDMGSGRWPREGYGRAASIDSIQRLISPPGGPNHWEAANDISWHSYADMGRPAADPSMYDVQFVPESGTTLGSHAFIGGPGFPVALGKWDEWEDISDTSGKRGPRFDALGSICLTQRLPDWTDAFMVGRDGMVWASWQTAEKDWSGFNSPDEWARLYFGDDETPKLDRKAKLAVVARTSLDLDIFAVGKDGRVYTVSWADAKGWSPWKNISGDNDKRFPSGAPIAVVSRLEGQIDVFINAGSDIWTSWWVDSTDPAVPAEWAEWVQMDRGAANIPGSADIIALSRQPGALTVAVTGQNGHVYAASWLQALGWSAFGDIGTSAPDISVTPNRPSRFAAGGKVAGVVGGPDRLDLFAVSSDKSLYTCSWTSADGWSGVGGDKFWEPLGYGTNDANVKIFDAATADVVAVKRRLTGDVDVFVTGTGGQVYRSYWSAGLNRWSTGFGAIGWDESAGAERKVVHDRGFRIGAASRNPSSLTVVSITTAGTALATAYEGLLGIF